MFGVERFPDCWRKLVSLGKGSLEIDLQPM